MSPRLAAPRGFTLMEVMISLALVSGLLVTLLYTLTHHLGVAEKHAATTVATYLAKAKLSELEKAPSEEKGAFPAPYSLFSYEASLRSSSYPGMVEVSVAVRYDDDVVRLSQLIRSRRR